MSISRPTHSAVWLAPSPGTRSMSHLESDAIGFVIARIAKRQAGVVARRQLLAAGLTGAEIDARVRGGHLHIVFNGVYAVGQRALSPTARYWAVVLAAGEDAVLAGWSAAAFAGALSDASRRPIVVAVPADRRPRVPGTRVRRLRLLPGERAAVSGLGATAPARTVLDIAATDGEVAAERAWRGYVHAGLLDLDAVSAVLAGHDGDRGIRAVARLYARRRTILGRARSGLEETVATWVVDAGLGEPVRDHRVVLSSGRVVFFDLAFPDRCLAIEADGPYHDDAEVAADDARRDAEALADGWWTHRVHHTATRERAIADLRALRARPPVGVAPTHRRVSGR